MPWDTARDAQSASLRGFASRSVCFVERESQRKREAEKSEGKRESEKWETGLALPVAG